MSQNMPRVTRNDVDRFVSVHLEMNGAFSAWDITKEMREEYWAPHSEVREFVHELMQPIVGSNSGWLKINVTLDNDTAFQVYYNSLEDLDAYIEIANTEQDADFDDNVVVACSPTDDEHMNVSRNPFRRLLDVVGNLAGSIFG